MSIVIELFLLIGSILLAGFAGTLLKRRDCSEGVHVKRLWVGGKEVSIAPELKSDTGFKTIRERLEEMK